MKKFLSLITVVIMASLLTLPVSAINGYDTVNENLKIEAKVKMVNSALGKAIISFTLTTTATDFKAGSEVYDSTWQTYSDGHIKGYNTSGVTYTPNSSVFSSKAGSATIVQLADYPYTIVGNPTSTAEVVLDLQESYKNYTAEQLNNMDIITVDSVTAEIKDYTCSKGTATLSKHTSYRTDGKGDFNITVVVPKASSVSYPSYAGNEALTGEETFANDPIFDGTPITSASKSFTVFGKATQALGIGEYGIKVKATDDKTYTFKGLAAVAKEGLWAIKVVSPDGTFNFADGETLTTKSIQTFEKGTFSDVSMN